EAHKYFEVDEQLDSPYMLLVAPVSSNRQRPLTNDEARASGIAKLKVLRSDIPAVTHVDCSARIQTVDRERHGLYRRLLEVFYRKTGCPVLINTSFNLGWDPIVCTPKEAYSTFMSCDLDVLCMGPFVLRKRQQKAFLPLRQTSMPASGDFLQEVVFCPCGSSGRFERFDKNAVTAWCGHKFPITDNIPQLFWPHSEIGDAQDVTER